MADTSPANRQDWNFKPLGDHFREAAGSAGGLALTFYAWMGLVGPAYAAISMAISTGYVFTTYLKTRSAENKDSNLWEKAGDDAQTIINKISKRFMLKSTPHIFKISDINAAKISQGNKAKQLNAEQKYEIGMQHARVLLDKNVIEYGSALKQEIDKARQGTKAFEYIVAHELAHIKAKDHKAIPAYAAAIQRDSPISMGTLLLSTFFIGSFTNLPTNALFTGVNGSGWTQPVQFLMLMFAGFLAMQYAQRIIEYRADRNAIWATRNVDAARNALQTISPEYKKFGNEGIDKPFIAILNMLSGHPRGDFRLKGIDRAHAEVTKWEARQP